MRPYFLIPALAAALTVAAPATPAFASDPFPAGWFLGVGGVQDPNRPLPPRRRLTTYMAHYPFGVVREDYTPLGAPGVSRRAYYGARIMTATLHTAVARVRHVRTVRHVRRTVLRVRY